MEIILTHKAPDADALASLLGAYLLFPNSLPLRPEGAPYPKQLFSLFGDVLPLYFPEEIAWGKVEGVTLVDCSSLERVGNVGEEIRRRGIPLTVIDHHLETRGEINVQRSLVKPYGSATTILVRMMREKGILPSSWQATLLALGVYSDTGSLTYSSTTEEDLQAAAFLVSCGANLAYIASLLHPPLSEEERSLLEEMRDSLQIEDVKGVKVGIGKATREEMDFNLAPLAESLMQGENVDALFLLLEVKGKTYIVGRSRGEMFEVKGILSRLGGGGHKNAGAGVMPCSVEETKERLLFLLPQGVKWEVEAGDIMSSPVKVVSANACVKEALEVMRSFGFSGLPINEKGRIIGVITRKEAEKLAKYGMGNRELGTFAYREPISVHPRTTLSQIIKEMNEKGVGRLLVMERGKLVGIITRQDIIGALYGQRLKERRGEQIIENIEPNLKGILCRIGEVAASLGMRSYLVGGVVRDIILGKEVSDFDILVEGKAIELAEKVVKEMNGELVSHQRFGTATVKLASGLEIDFASARREFYERAAVLPIVEPGSLREDLFRRDFTINALALSLHPQEFGFLIDYFGGLDDLRNKRIKALHSLSFWEDPTRILRAIRLEAKLGFKMERWTEGLAIDAIKSGALAPLSGERLREELKLTLEENPLACLRRMEELGIIKAIHPKGELDKKLLRKLVKESLDNLEVERWIIYLYPLLSQLDEGEIRRVTYRLRLTSSQREKCLALIYGEEARKKLQAPRMKRSQIYEVLKGIPLETIVWIGAKGDRKVKKRVSLFLEELRHINLALKGEDLIQLGIAEGPQMGKILQELFQAKLDGKVKSREEEINFVLKKKEGKFG